VALFSYRAITMEGAAAEGLTEASDEKNVIEKLRAMGLLPLSIEVPREGLKRRIRLTSSKGQLLLFTTELSALLTAGLPLDRGLIILSEASDDDDMKGTTMSIVRSLREGRAFSEALREHPRVFPRFYVNMIRAGEAAGVLDAILGKLKEFLESSRDLRESIVSATIYPVMLLGTGGVAITILLTFVLPKFSVIFADMGKSLPTTTQMLLALSGTLRAYWWAVLSAAILVWAAASRYIKTDRGRHGWDALKLRVLGSMIRKLETARFSRTLGTLLGGGVPLTEAINNARDVIGNQAIAAALSEASQAVREGKGIGITLAGTNALPSLAVSMIRVGEETGQLEAMLLQIATLYEGSLKGAVKRFVSLLEPALIVFMGLVIGFIVISMLSAIFSITDLPV